MPAIACVGWSLYENVVQMKQAVWTGAISFGLVSIPVRLYPATDPKDVRFHLYDRRSGKRVRYERVTRVDDAPLFLPEPSRSADEDAGDSYEDANDSSDEPRSLEDATPAAHDWAPAPERSVDAQDIVRGFSLPSGDLVTVSDDELDVITPPRSRTIDIEEFVQLAEIDPIFFDKSYYVAPGRASATEKPYALLLQAMRSAGMVAIGRFVLRTRPHLVAIRALENALVLETLFFGDEVRRAEDVVGAAGAASVSERELKMAQQLVRALSTEWVPEKHADVYRNELLELLQRKSPALPAPEQEAAADGSPVDDLMAMLKASVDAAKARSSNNGYSSVTQRRGKRARGSA
jgi:DNA end-binding protein Ku